MKLLKQGAEAILYLDKNKLVKERIKKGYRISELDKRLRESRTKREAKLLGDAARLINVPIVFDKKDVKIEMEFIKGGLLRDIFSSLKKEHLEAIGKQIAILHNNNIIHGDLTTSNMILMDDRVYFIDFGLGFYSNKIEDKAVDLHLLKQAIEAKHHKNLDSFNAILEGYKAVEGYKAILERLEKVEKRGRYRSKEKEIEERSL